MEAQQPSNASGQVRRQPLYSGYNVHTMLDEEYNDETGQVQHTKKWIYEPLFSSSKARWIIVKNRQTSAHFVSKIVQCQTPHLRKSVQEARILNDLKHPNVIKYLGQQVLANCYYFHYEYADGKLLQFDVFSTNNGLPLASVKRYFKHLIDGLDFVHENGYAVRNLQLKSLLLTADDVVKISNFTAACSFRDICNIEFPLRGQMGPVNYMAPETFTNDCYQAEPADIFSSGIILFNMSVGRFPWKTAEEEHATYALFPDVRIWQHECFRSVPYECRQLIQLILAKDPRTRGTLAAVRKTAFFNTSID